MINKNSKILKYLLSIMATVLIASGIVYAATHDGITDTTVGANDTLNAGWFDAVRDHVRNHPSSSGGGNIECSFFINSSINKGACVNIDTGRVCYSQYGNNFYCTNSLGYTLSGPVECTYSDYDSGDSSYVKTISCFEKATGNYCTKDLIHYNGNWFCGSINSYSI